jgi:acetyl esterase/lipase
MTTTFRKSIRAAILSASALAFALTVTAAALMPEPDKPNFRVIELWPNGAPGATGTTDEDRPAVIPFIPDAAKSTGAAVLVCPGGAFTTRATDHEGVLVAQWFKARGVAAFLLRYRLRPLYAREHWLRDGQRGLQFVRAHAKEYGVSPHRVGIIGFSAGANLAADAAFHTLPARPDAADPLDRVPSRPDFLILSYGSAPLPASAAGAAAEAGMTPPPTFMFCTVEDAMAVRGMSELFAALRQAKAPVEAHFFQNGEHGTGFAQGDPVLGEWPNLMYKWMHAGGFLADGPRVPVKGLVKLDGAPLVRGVVILTPVDKPGAPPVVAYVTNTGTGPLGQFSVAQNQGPVAGRYRVEVRQDATRWTSNSRDPVMIKMMGKAQGRTLTDEDRKEWGEYIRKRDLSPSIEEQRVFRRQRPKDRQDYVVEIKDGGDDQLNIEVFSR